MTRKREEAIYDGNLAKPIREFSDEASARAEWERRFYLLLAVYEIEPSDPEALQKLAIALAMKHARGLQFDLKPHPGGRPLEWPEQRQAALALAVHEIRQKGHASTDKDACAQLSRKHSRNWGKPAKYQGTAEQWQRHLQNMASKGRKTFSYRIATGPPGLKMIYELFFPADRAQMAPDENGSYLGALLKRPIT